MKTTKRVLSIALALLLGVGLLVPSMAVMVDTTAVTPQITSLTPAQNVKAGTALTLEVGASLPNGETDGLTYAWYDADPGDDCDQALPIGTEAKLSITATQSKLYYVVVTFMYPFDEQGIEVPWRASGTVKVTVYEEGGPNAPVITKQPQMLAFVYESETLRLTIDARLPTGIDGELSIAWYDYDWQEGDEAPPVATGANLVLPIPIDERSVMYYDFAEKTFRYCAVVTNTYINGEGEAQSAFVKSMTGEVIILPSLNKVLSDIWIFVQGGNGPTYGVLALIMGSPLLLLFLSGLLPFYFIINISRWLIPKIIIP